MQSPGKTMQPGSMEEKVLEWQRQLLQYDNNKDGEKLVILQDSEIDATVKTVVQVLSSATENENLILVQASLDILAVVALQDTGKTLYVSGGVLKRISDILRKSSLSQKFLVSPTSSPSTPSIFSTEGSTASLDEKKDEELVVNQYDNATYQIPATALHCLANLSEEASDAIKQNYLLPLANPQILNLMDQYLASASIQRYACKLIYHLSNPLLQELLAAGSVALLWRALQAHPDDADLQHYANAALYNLLPICPPHTLKEIVHPQQLVQGLVPGMTATPSNLALQTYGLLVMTRVVTSTNPTTPSNQNNPASPKRNSFVARFSQLKSPSAAQDKDLDASHALGLDHVIFAILNAMNSHYKEPKVAQVGCNLLKLASKQSTDFCTNMIQHGGLRILVQIMHAHLDDTSIQDPAMACVRNLVSLRSNNVIANPDSNDIAMNPTEAAALSIRKLLSNESPNKDQEGGGDDLADVIRAIGLVMTIHANDAPIQAYGCDAMGRLAVLDEYVSGEGKNEFWVRKSLFQGNALRLALQSMRNHPQHLGVQDRAIVLLQRLCSYEPAFEFLRQPQEGPVESEDEASSADDGSIGMPTTPPSSKKEPEQSFLYKMLQETKVPPKKECRDRLQRLMSIVNAENDKNQLNDEEDGNGSSIFGKLTVETASERMKSLRESFTSPITSPRDWATPLAQKWTNRPWKEQSPPSS